MSVRYGDTEIAILITIITEPDRSGPAWNQRITLYSCHCEALWAHLEMKRSKMFRIITVTFDFFI